MYQELFKNLPPQLSTLLVAMLPVAELRVSIPLALNYYHLSILSAFFWSVVGNMIPVIFIMFLIGPVSNYLTGKSQLFNRFFTWLFKRTRHKFNSHYEKYGMLALAIFVAIPLPATGAWSGGLAAWLFGLPVKKSIFYILLGVIGAGLIVSLASLGIFNLTAD